MCRYISIALPKTAKMHKLETALLKHGFGCRPFESTFVSGQLKEGTQLVNTTARYCDCDSVVGSAAHNSRIGVTAQDIMRLQRKGWSETKINNWIANKEKSSSFGAREQERQQWLNLLRELILEKNIGVVGLYIHWYEQGLGNEKIVFRRKEKMPLSAVQGYTLDTLEDDVLYEFIP